MPRSRDWTDLDTWALISVTAAGGLLRLARLAQPSSIVFDETYYAKDACWYVNVSPTICEVAREQTEVHPPLAKWLLAIGIRLFGFDAFGWRIAAVVAGTITIALVYLLARKILRSTVGATLAAGLLAIDLLHFVQSRIAMLDIFIPMFGMACFLFLVYDRDRMLARLDARSPSGAGLLDRPWRIAAGAAAGAATATKWSGVFFVFATILLTFVWETALRHAELRAGGEATWADRLKGRLRASWRTVVEEGTSMVLWLGVLPVLVYVGTYPGRIEGNFLALPWAEGSWLRALWDRHNYMWDFHSNLTSPHTYESPSWAWVLLKRPVSYFFCSGEQCNPRVDEGSYVEIFAAGSPFVWWAAVLALLYVAYVWVRKRDLRRSEGVILAGVALTYGLWLLPMTNRSTMFLFYFLPTVPFLGLALAYVATRIGETWEAKAAIGLFCAGALASFIWYFPLIASVPIPQQDWDKRIWVFDNCEKPPGVLTTETTTQTSGAAVVTTTFTTNDNSSLPPIGWCWI